MEKYLTIISNIPKLKKCWSLKKEINKKNYMEDDSNFVHSKYGNIRTLFAKVRGSFRVYLFSSLERNLLKAEVCEKERTKTRIWWWWFCFSCNQSIMCCLWTFVELLLLVNYLKWELAMHQANSIKRKNKRNET